MVKAAQQNKPKAATDKTGKLAKSILAVAITLVPLFSAGVWVKTTFFSDYRHTVDLKQIETPGAPPKLFEEPIISVTFDDGWESVYSKGAPLFEKYGIRTTQYVLSGTFDYYNYMSRQQILSMQSAGHDIESHTVNHNDLTTLNDNDLNFELRQSKADISKLTGKVVEDFASPLDRYNDQVIDAVGEYYRSHRNTIADIATLHDDSFNTIDNFDPYQISAFSVRRTTTIDDIKRFIAKAKTLNAWIVLIYHQIEDEDQGDYYAVSQNSLESQLKVVAESGMRIATVDEVIDVYEAIHGGN